MKQVLFIFPNQLYVSKNDMQRYDEVYLIEEPIFFYDPKYKPFRPNKVKLAFLRASMKAFYDAVVSNSSIKYINYQQYNTFCQTISQNTFINFYDPLDFDVIEKYNKIFKNNSITMLESPDLIINKEVLYNKYFKSHEKTQRHASFYEFVKKELDILKNVKNLDKDNRNPPPKVEPNIYKYLPKSNFTKYYKEAITYVNQQFSEHYGDTENVVIYPITQKEAEISFKTFLKKSLENFGKYEDAVMIKDPFMYHSVISPLLNNGLLNPKKVIEMTLEYYEHNKHIPLASLEGFVRQVIGWRCMMQGMYIFKHKELVESNTPNNQYTFKDWNIWYKGETGILPLDEEIKKANKYAYSHHIVRLMIFMNFFILCELHPDVIYKWFMEVVSIDAYSWVMISNIYSMGYFYSKMMTKPYLSTSNYIVKMTNYKRDGHWDKIWDALYHDFLRKKPTNYTFFYKRTFKNDDAMKKVAEDFKRKYFILYKN